MERVLASQLNSFFFNWISDNSKTRDKSVLDFQKENNEKNALMAIETRITRLEYGHKKLKIVEEMEAVVDMLKVSFVLDSLVSVIFYETCPEINDMTQNKPTMIWFMPTTFFRL